MNLAGLRLGYVPYRADCSAPGDRRRFAGWAKSRGVAFEIADPSGDYDAVVISEAADITAWSRYSGRARLVYDLIDAYLALPRSDPKALLRGAAKSLTRQFRHPALNYWAAVRRMCRRADLVVCATEEQRRDVFRDNGNVHVVLDLQEADARGHKQSYTAGRPFALVWEGLPVNIRALAQIAPALNRLARRHELVLHLVTDPAYFAWMGRFGRRASLAEARRHFANVTLHPWSAATLPSVATGADLAIIPIPRRDALAMGKPENKLLLFWRMGVPAVTSATPAYARAMLAAGVDLTCATRDDWERTLERCITDEALRREAGEKGRAYATREHSDARILERWDRVFESLTAGKAAG